MVQFLMYDKTMKGKITVEDTLELLYVRVGRYNLDKEIYSIFGQEEKTVLVYSYIRLTDKRKPSTLESTWRR